MYRIGRRNNGGSERKDGIGMRFRIIHRFDVEWFSIGSDLSVNLAAGWLGVAFIVPNFFGIRSPLNFLILTGDIFMAIVFLVTAFKLKKLSKEDKYV